MKKIRTLFIALFISASTMAMASDANVETTDPEIRAEQIENRVHEIWKMDFSEMDKVEKLQLKQELKSLKKELKTSGLDDRVSISIGAIIIILLIIIIIA